MDSEKKVTLRRTIFIISWIYRKLRGETMTMKKNFKQLVVAFVLGLVLVQGVTTVNGQAQPSTRASIDVPWWC